MNATDAIQEVLNSCAICGFHTREFAILNCPNPDHPILWRATEENPLLEENAILRGDLQEAKTKISNLTDRLDRIAGCEMVISGEMAHIKDAVDVK